MSFQIFDYRNEDHIKNLLVTPNIRSRFLRMEPGQVAGRHSHDLGHEIFLILQGSCIFDIEGEEQELHAGQLCLTLPDEIHQVRVTSDEPMIMYLSVTPHIQPTHTGRDPDGTRHPTAFQPSSSYDVETDTETAARYNADLQIKYKGQLKAALADGDEEKAGAIREQMWQGVYQSHKTITAMDELWNDLTPRAGKVG